MATAQGREQLSAGDGPSEFAGPRDRAAEREHDDQRGSGRKCRGGEQHERFGDGRVHCVRGRVEQFDRSLAGDGEREHDCDGLSAREVPDGDGHDGRGGGRGGGIGADHCVRDEPCVRRRERDGDADYGDESDDRNAGDAELPEHAHEPGKLHGDDTERNGGDYEQYMDGEHDGDHDHGEYRAGGVDGIHDQVLVRGVLERQGIGSRE